MSLPYQKVHVVINPAAGQDEPILNVLNHIFHPAGVDWDISLTHKSGDATRLAAEAAASGVDLVAAYGGDGTQMEVANGLLGTGVPQAILPGGTGNAMAHDLGVSLKLWEAVELIVSSNNRRAIDLAKIGDKVFMLRAYAGLSEDQAASREKKDQYGQLASAVYIIDCLVCQLLVCCQIKRLIRVDDINQIVWNLLSFVLRRLCSAYVHVAVYLTAIGAYDFPVESLS